MGQYHSIYNLDKKETMDTHSLGDGPKLLEWGLGGLYTAGIALLLSNSNGRGIGDLYIGYPEDVRMPNGDRTLTPKGAEMQRRIDAVSGRWAGDRIVVQGDYAEETDPAYIADRDSFADISQLVIDALATDEYCAAKMDGFYGALTPTPMPAAAKPKVKRVRKPKLGTEEV